MQGAEFSKIDGSELVFPFIQKAERFEEIDARRGVFEATSMQVLDIASTYDLLIHEFRHVRPVLQFTTSLWEADGRVVFDHGPHFLALEGFQSSELGEVDWAVQR